MFGLYLLSGLLVVALAMAAALGCGSDWNITIGAVLARSQANALVPTPLAEFVPVALIKLLLHPLLVWTLGRAAIALGAPLDPFALDVLVLLACLPSASNVALLAERFGADTGRVARIILVSTALSFLSLSTAVSLLK